MSRRILIATTSILAIASFSAFTVTACSSSSSSSPGTVDSGSGSGGEVDSGSSSGGSSGGSSGSSSGGSDAGDNDAGVCTAAASVSNIPDYAPVTQQNVCTVVQIQAAVAACFGTSASQTTCNTWLTASANAGCAPCALGAEPDGGINAASAVACNPGGCFLNSDACIQIRDGNTTCASADWAVGYCLSAACASDACLADLTGAQNGNTADETAYNNCQTSAESLACTTQTATWNTDCGMTADAVDGGSLDFCQAQTTADVTRIMALICDSSGN